MEKDGETRGGMGGDLRGGRLKGRRKSNGHTTKHSDQYRDG